MSGIVKAFHCLSVINNFHVSTMCKEFRTDNKSFTTATTISLLIFCVEIKNRKNNIYIIRYRERPSTFNVYDKNLRESELFTSEALQLGLWLMIKRVRTYSFLDNE